MTGSTSTVEDYLMGMLSVTDEISSSRKRNNSSKKQCPKATIEDTSKISSPIVQTTEKEISPGVKQYTMKIIEENPCSGTRAQKHTSYVLNEKTGTLITVERTDMTTVRNKQEQIPCKIPKKEQEY